MTVHMATYLITGANRGIGYEYCRQLEARRETVVAVCRTTSHDLHQLGVQVEDGVDITSDDSIADLRNRLGDQTIDVLINNAGILEEETLETLNFDSIREQFEVNALGALRITHALLPNLRAGSKVVLMTSRMGSIADNSSGSYYGYRMSKAALSMVGKSLSHDLKPRGIAVAILHPGLVQTRMTDFYGITPQESVQKLLSRIDELTLENTGTFWHANGEVLPWELPLLVTEAELYQACPVGLKDRRDCFEVEPLVGSVNIATFTAIGIDDGNAQPTDNVSGAARTIRNQRSFSF
nr:SDR family oxidoreductase [Leptolyngbya sp. FACHB-711]